MSFDYSVLSQMDSQMLGGVNVSIPGIHRTLYCQLFIVCSIAELKRDLRQFFKWDN